jgi:hypothetical protein
MECAMARRCKGHDNRLRTLACFAVRMTFSGRPSPDSIATMICGTNTFRSGREGMISTYKKANGNPKQVLLGAKPSPPRVVIGTVPKGHCNRAQRWKRENRGGTFGGSIAVSRSGLEPV